MDKQSIQKSSHDRRSHAREFIVARNHRPGPDWIPGTIVEVLGRVTYIIEIEEGGQHINRTGIAPTSSDNSRSQPGTHHSKVSNSFLIVLILLLTQILLSLLQIQLIQILKS
jgi:hypothetical protein